MDFLAYASGYEKSGVVDVRGANIAPVRRWALLAARIEYSLASASLFGVRGPELRLFRTALNSQPLREHYGDYRGSLREGFP